MAALSSFHPEILIDYPGVPPAILDAAVVHGAIRAANATTLVRESLAAFPTVAATRSYALACADSTNAEVAKVRRVRVVDGRWLTDTTDNDGETAGDLTGPPTHYLYADGSLSLYPIPTGVESIAVTVATRPKRTATVIGDKYLNDEDLFNAVVAEAKRWLAMQHRRPWGAPQMAQAHEFSFQQAAERSLIRAILGENDGALAATPRGFQ